MSKTARVIVTTRCNRACPGCVSATKTCSDASLIPTISYVFDYDTIILTGGEPMLKPHSTIALAKQICNNSEARILLYSALFDPEFEELWEEIIVGPDFDGFQFTLHADATPDDVSALRHLSQLLANNRLFGHISRRKSFRLSVDKSLYEQYDFSNIDFTGWNSVRKLVWLDDCPLPKDEKLFHLEFFGMGRIDNL
jgi:organic radical activating enzyme